MFVKSQKLLQAFLSRVRVTERDVQRTTAWQVFMVLIFFVFANATLYVGHHQQPLQILTIVDEDNNQRIHYCNTYVQGNLMLGCVMVIQLLCSIQAFRGRNLPAFMNDAMILTYATFTGTVIFGVTFPIVHFQEPTHKELMQSAAVVINTCITCFLLYGQRAFRMLLCSGKNTKHYFRTKRLDMVIRSVTEL